MTRDPKSHERFQLCAVDRIVRAQVFEGADSFAHFTLLGVAVAGRDQGDRRFETEALIATLRGLSQVVRQCMNLDVRVRLTDFDGKYAEVISSVSAAVSDDGIRCDRLDERTAGADYYSNVCFKMYAETKDEMIEVGDGGTVDWTARLLGNRKERLLIGGLGFDRLALQVTS